MYTSNSKPKFKVGDKVKTVHGEFEVLWVGNILYTEKQVYVCYKEGFNGHSAKETVGSGIFENTKYKGQCWNFSEDDLELVDRDSCKQHAKNYRELTPDTLIDISIDGNEFKVKLGDFIHAKALLGVSNGKYGYELFASLTDVFDNDSFITKCHEYDYINTSISQNSLMKTYFIDKEREAKKQALKDVIEKQREEISKLEQELIVLDDYDGCSL